MSDNQKIDVYLVCNARYHDTNFARLELLKLLAENEDIHTRVAENFSDIEAIKASTLLEANYNQPSTGYVQSEYGTDRDSQPQMYLHPFGDGEVLYLSLGHCSGKHDMKPIVDIQPVVRGSWDNPVYYELLRRGISWGVNTPSSLHL